MFNENIVGAVVSGLFGLMYLGMSNIFNIIRYYLLRKCSAEGEIIRLEKSEQYSYLYRSVAKFKIGDEEITAQSEQLLRKYDALKVGTPVMVRFRLSNPQKTALFDLPLRFNIAYFMFGLLFLAASLTTLMRKP